LTHQKIKKVEKLLIYDEHSLSQIADALQHKSVQHLSIQFKKITGLNQSRFKELKKREQYIY